MCGTIANIYLTRFNLVSRASIEYFRGWSNLPSLMARAHINVRDPEIAQLLSQELPELMAERGSDSGGQGKCLVVTGDIEHRGVCEECLDKEGNDVRRRY
jgi:hypothetical protein